MKNKFNRFAWIGLVLIALLAIVLPNKAQLQNSSGLDKDLPPMDVYQKEVNPKMESTVYRLMKVYFTQGIEEAKEFARKRSIDMEGDLVRLVIEAQPRGRFDEAQTSASLVSQQIESLGGKVETTYQHLIQSIVPLSIIQDLADFPSVKYIRLPIKAVPLVVSEGVSSTGADKWQEIESYRTTTPVKVCILDLGFKGYDSLLGTELPSTVVTRSFRADGNLKAHVHGTACAEIVHDMAPDAKLYLVNFSTSVEHHNAVNWIINQGVDVISYSIAWFNAGAGNGTGPICEDVKKATNNGIKWISAAGNEAQNHWEGIFNDPEPDSWHNFSGTDEIQSFYVPAYTPVSLYLNWNDWGTWNGTSYSGSDQDYDLYLYIYWSGHWYLVDYSINWQSGSQRPVEYVGGWYTTASTYWGAVIEEWSTTKNCKMELFVSGNSGPIEYNKPEGSLTIPADSTHTVTVGAVDWSDDSYHYYSSRGPTSDNRVKPDFCAPAGTSGHTYGYRGFYGTSAATPHVAGAFALLKGKTPFTLDQIQTILEARAKDLGSTGKDNKYGIGSIKLKK